MAKSPESELETFLATLPRYVRKEFEHGFASLSQDEQIAWINYSCSCDIRGKSREEFERLLQRIPAKWRAYRKRVADEAKQTALIGMPASQRGAPRKDALRDEAAELRKRGLSWAEIAKHLNLAHGKEASTRESVRKLVGRLKSSALSPPDKNQS